MVYCGKPSKGCGTCRTRRLKCDQKRPGCSQCKNTGRTCLGYRDQNDLVFRDESQRITRKFQKTAEAKEVNTTQSAADVRRTEVPLHKPTVITRRSGSPEQEQIPISIHHSIHDIAVNFLLGDYVRGSHFGYLPSLYHEDPENAVLSPIIKAVALASLSLQTSRRELQDQARKLYVDAIANTNVALQSEHTARNDAVLASILLLSLYETLNTQSCTSIDAWGTHMQGAMTLLAIRGPAQFDSKFGLEIFDQIATSVRVFCIQQYIRIPQQLRDLTKIAARLSHPDHLSFNYTRAVEAVTDLRADVTEGLLTQPEGIIERAKEVIQVISEVQEKIRSVQVCHASFVGTVSPGTYGDPHRLKEHYLARIWNTAWMGKMRLNTIIYEQLLQLAKRAPAEEKHINIVAEMANCQREVMEAAENICASASRFFPTHDRPCCSQNPRTAAMGYFLIWPLFTAGASTLIKAETREYAIQRLEFIAEDLNLPQAHKAAEMLAQGDYCETWMHVYHVFDRLVACSGR